jgi:hypothetical protein
MRTILFMIGLSAVSVAAVCIYEGSVKSDPYPDCSKSDYVACVESPGKVMTGVKLIDYVTSYDGRYFERMQWVKPLTNGTAPDPRASNGEFCAMASGHDDEWEIYIPAEPWKGQYLYTRESMMKKITYWCRG